MPYFLLSKCLQDSTRWFCTGRMFRVSEVRLWSQHPHSLHGLASFTLSFLGYHMLWTSQANMGTMSGNLVPKAIQFFLKLESLWANGSITHKIFSSQMYWCSSSTYEAMSWDTESQQRVEQLQTCRCYQERFLSSGLKFVFFLVLFFPVFTHDWFFLNKHFPILKHTYVFK